MNLDNKAAMVVFSGGQDSTTCLGWALQEYERVECISFNYGQKHSIELGAAREVVQFFKAQTGRSIPHHLVTCSALLRSSSPLTNPAEPLETYKDHAEMEAIIGDRVEKTFVPLRNPFFLNIAANFAVAAGIADLVTGVCQADNANYPDCREVFVDAMEDMLNRALGLEDTERGSLCIQTPLMHLSKAQSIRLAQSLPHTYEALAWSHTAYDGTYPPTSMDHASILRAHGFEEAGVPDPLVMRAFYEGLMELPATANYDAVREARA